LCFALTERKYLAALSCSAGDLLWRQHLQDDRYAAVQPVEERIVSVSQLGVVQAWSVYTGHLLWTSKTAAAMGLSALHVSASINSSIFAMIGNSVYRLSKEDGSVIWQHAMTGVGAETLYKGISADDTHVYAVSTIPSGQKSRSHQLHVTKLSVDTGNMLDQHGSLGPVLTDGNQVLALSVNGPDHSIIWHEENQFIKIGLLNSHKVIQIKPKSSFKHASAQTFSVEEGLILALTLSDEIVSWVEVYRVRENAELVYRVSEKPSDSSITTLALDASKEAFLVRISAVEEQAFVEVWGTRDGNPLLSTEMSLNTSLSSLDRAAAEVSSEDDGSLAVRTMVTSTDGTFAMMRDSRVDWLRDEGLSATKDIIIVQLPEPVSAKEVLFEASHNVLASFIARLQRHAMSIAHIFRGKAGEAVQAGEALHRDHFGFRQFAMAFADRGRIWALDSGKAGAVRWSFPACSDVATLRSASLLETSAENDWGAPVIAVVYDQPAKAGIVVWKINALNGHRISQEHFDDAKGAMLLPSIESRDLAVLKSDESLAIWKASQRDALAIADAAQNLALVTIDGNALVGHGFSSSSLMQHELWRFQLPKNGVLVAHALQDRRKPVASVGRVLGDRGVLYKFLHRALAAALSYDPERQEMTATVLDAVTGSVLHQATHAHVGQPDVHAFHVVLAENWLAYHYWADKPSKGYQITITELYEGPRNVRADGNPLPYAISKSFSYDHAVSFLSVTDTAQGITSRDLLVGLANGQLATVSRKLLDPRRPLPGKLSSADKEEMLVPYDPVLKLEPKQILSHINQVHGMRGAAVFATLLESTALVCVYGLDIFLTRVSPSMAFDTLSASFSKAQIISSAALLLVAILITRPMARAQQLNRRWIG
jgi:hypothetical protein